MQITVIGILLLLGSRMGSNGLLSITPDGIGTFIYQQYLIKDRDRQKCFRAFLNNQ